MVKKIASFLVTLSIVFFSNNMLVYAVALPTQNQDTYTEYGLPHKDAYVDEDVTSNHSNTNYGQSTSVDIKSNTSKNRQALTAYDLSFLQPNQQIQSAEIYMYMHNEASSNSNRTYGVSSILAPWVEGNGGTDNSPVDEVDWLNKPQASTSVTSTTLITPGTQWVSFDVTHDVKNIALGASSNGWLIKDMYENSTTSYLAEFYSKEYTGTACTTSESPYGCKPYIKVVYTEYKGGVSGFVWNDANSNGTQDEGESPREGETITLSGAVNASTTTNAEGKYTFSEVPTGVYTVCRSEVNTTAQTFPTTGPLCANGFVGGSVEVVADSIEGPSFGVRDISSVTIVLETDPLYTEEAFSVFLVQGEDYVRASHVFTGAGQHVFDDVVPGHYTLTQLVPSGWFSLSTTCVSGDATFGIDFSITAGERIVCTFTQSKTSSLTVTNYSDTESTYSFTLSDQEGVLVASPVTLANTQSHTFTDIKTGTYNLSEMVEGEQGGETAVCVVGSAVVDPRNTSLSIPAGAHIQCTYTHGQFSVIQGAVFEDMNADGLRAEDDPALSLWKVTLFKHVEQHIGEGAEEVVVPSLSLTEVASQLTTDAGYVFGELDPGTYTVCHELQSGFTQSTPLSGDECSGSWGHRVVLDFGDIETRLFGDFSTGSVSGKVFSDTNNNKVMDEGESGMSGISVLMGDFSTATNSEGAYEFTNIQPGEYTLIIQKPDGMSYSLPDAGAYTYTIVSGQNVPYTDFGLYVVQNNPEIINPPSSGGGNGPIVGSFGGNNVVTNNTLPEVPPTPALAVGGSLENPVPTEENPPLISNTLEGASTTVVQRKIDTPVIRDVPSVNIPEIQEVEQATSSGVSNLAAVGTQEWDSRYWTLLLIVISVGGGVYYFTRRQG